MFQSKNDIFEILSEAISEAIIIVDEKQTIVATNTSASTIFGYTENEMRDKPLDILIPTNYRPSHSGHFNSFFGQSEKRRMGLGRELYGLKKNGTEVPVEVGLNPFEVYGKKYVMALVIDITYRKQAEKEIHELNTQLEEKVKERTSELNKTVKKLKELNTNLETEVKRRIEAENKIKEALKKEKELGELKTKFLSLVSHEFKTPLSGILTSATLLGKYKLTEQQEKREKHLDIIKNKVHYLNGILNDFLSVEKLESGKIKYNFTNFNVSKVVNEVIYDANMLLKYGQKINYPEEIEKYSICQDEKILELILLNLVRNAIKYSPENTVIDLGVSLDNDKIIFKITDEGIGIPEKDQKYIFQRYFRAENALLDQGTGIGLNIVKSHLDSLGGKISFTSKENEGTTFVVELPIQN
ncbi:PAS domain-containing sensor histidine kinase [Abyssalbus ytuae]|uniref:histidine kinase n=1 Tax=Abyssalbus ytuae TaxID=2926907 RepID=A0A9E6ZP44_9FLAO|nr:PAS domain-containing sensor histidine kinase [Abyssalbus ytuae]UOB17930.1 PAS domain-containing sensor histidine kinase [Abyssalbus ytuae]